MFSVLQQYFFTSGAVLYNRILAVMALSLARSICFVNREGGRKRRNHGPGLCVTQPKCAVSGAKGMLQTFQPLSTSYLAKYIPGDFYFQILAQAQPSLRSAVSL